MLGQPRPGCATASRIDEFRDAARKRQSSSLKQGGSPQVTCVSAGRLMRLRIDVQRSVIGDCELDRIVGALAAPPALLVSQGDVVYFEYRRSSK